MYRIAICDDEAVFLESHKRIVEAILQKNAIPCTVEAFSSGEALLNSSRSQFDLVFLDILMDGINGIELARALQKEQHHPQVVFVTSREEYALQGYEVHALHFLMKPLDPAKVEKLLLSDYQNRYQPAGIVLQCPDRQLRVKLRDILYLETEGRRVKVRLPEGDVYHSGKLSELLEKLPGRQFAQCHRSIAVNLAQVRELGRGSAVLQSGEALPVSRSFSAPVHEAFLLWAQRETGLSEQY